MKKLFVLLFSLFILLLSMSAQPIKDKEAVVTTDEVELTILQKIEKWYDQNMNYATITILMTVESSFIPFPSEVVVPPAAYIASQPDSHLNIFLVVLFATIGALIGALINYFLALYLGRPIVYKFADSKIGHLLLLSKDKIIKAEDYFNERGNTSTLVGRLVPVIRQLISIPAGLARMNMASFLLYTFIGAGIWNIILAFLGYILHGQQDLINKYSQELSYLFLIVVILFIGYFIIKQVLKKRKSGRNLV